MPSFKLVLCPVTFFPLGSIAPCEPLAPHYRGFKIIHNQTRDTRYDFSGRVIGPMQRPLLANTQHSQHKDIHAHGGISTQKPSKRATAGQCLRPRGHWDRLSAAIRCLPHRKHYFLKSQRLISVKGNISLF